MPDEKIVAVGLLTSRDLQILGSGFDRCFPVSDGLEFADLLHAIDEADAAAARRRKASPEMEAKHRTRG